MANGASRCRKYLPAARDYMAASLWRRAGLRINETLMLDIRDWRPALGEHGSSTSATAREASARGPKTRLVPAINAVDSLLEGGRPRHRAPTSASKWFVAQASDAPVGAIDVVRLGYDALGARYHEWSRDTSLRVRFVQQLLDRLSNDSRVLDLGCGPGDPTARLLSERFAVVGVDLSHVQIGLARKAAPTAAFVVGDMTHLGLRRGAFDAVVSFYAFGHLPSALHREVLTDIRGWLRPGGLLVANAPVGTGNGVHDWLGVQMFFGGIGATPTFAAIEDAGLLIESAEEMIEDEGDGHTATFLWVCARKERA